MPALFLKDSDTFLADLSDADLARMAEVMEEESSKDTDYFIDLGTVDLLRRAGTSERVTSALEAAIGESEGIDVVWR
ncbi:MAG TPA: hypothetical protein VK325_12940 [Pseudoxanthomonas sp.]|nr:hypothetical protein [Pseudoxanthomonas sp.]